MVSSKIKKRSRLTTPKEQQTMNVGEHKSLEAPKVIIEAKTNPDKIAKLWWSVVKSPFFTVKHLTIKEVRQLAENPKFKEATFHSHSSFSQARRHAYSMGRASVKVTLLALNELRKMRKGRHDNS